MKSEPRRWQTAAQERKKPRPWESWLSLVSAVAGAFVVRGTAQGAPQLQFTRNMPLGYANKTLTNFRRRSASPALAQELPIVPSCPALPSIGLAYRLHAPSLEFAMARKKKLDFSDIGTDRKKENLNQMDFWQRYGVTQSGGSRYESGRNIPKPLAILLWLHRSGKVTDKDLADALK
jgi:hypothetical protein